MKTLVLLVCVIVVALCVSCSYHRELQYYKQYYAATENLLDTLNEYYDWVDAIDPQEYYDAREKLN